MKQENTKEVKEESYAAQMSYQLTFFRGREKQSTFIKGLPEPTKLK
jgi:hypothetical protein